MTNYLSFIDGTALEYAISFVYTLPTGTIFTAKKVFENTIIVDCDPRCIGAIMRELERGKLIENIGSTTRDQENRHNGLSTLWKKM